MCNNKIKWNQDLYEYIEKKVNSNMPFFEKEYNIDESKYNSFVKNIEEEYYTHPDADYLMSIDNLKQFLKKDLDSEKKYIKKSLIKKTRTIKFHGDAINQAIKDASSNAKGGRVVIKGSDNSNEPKVYYTGAIKLESNVELHVEENAILKFVRNKTNEFYPLVFTRWEGVEMMNFSPFIYSYEAENIAITGNGILDGQVDEFNWMPWKFGYFNEEDQKFERDRLFNLGEQHADVETKRIFTDKTSTLRPPFIQPYKTKNILIKDITILNSPFWEVNPVLCENIKVDNLKIDTNLYNNDGVDPESSKDIIIENTNFNTGDDCIAIKSGRNNDGRRINIPTENMIIRNNKFANGHGGITLGSEISGGVRNILAHNNYFDSEELDYPIRFKTNAKRGAILENVYIKDSTVNKSKLAVIHADFFYEEGLEGDHTPVLRNILLSGIKTVEGGSIDAINALYIKGFDHSPIENIVLEDLNLSGVKNEAVLSNVNNIKYKNVVINGEKLEDKIINYNSKGNEVFYRVI